MVSDSVSEDACAISKVKIEQESRDPYLDLVSYQREVYKCKLIVVASFEKLTF